MRVCADSTSHLWNPTLSRICVIWNEVVAIAEWFSGASFVCLHRRKVDCLWIFNFSPSNARIKSCALIICTTHFNPSDSLFARLIRTRLICILAIATNVMYLFSFCFCGKRWRDDRERESKRRREGDKNKRINKNCLFSGYYESAAIVNHSKVFNHLELVIAINNIQCEMQTVNQIYCIFVFLPASHTNKHTHALMETSASMATATATMTTATTTMVIVSLSICLSIIDLSFCIERWWASNTIALPLALTRSNPIPFRWLWATFLFFARAFSLSPSLLVPNANAFAISQSTQNSYDLRLL